MLKKNPIFSNSTKQKKISHTLKRIIFFSLFFLGITLSPYVYADIPLGGTLDTGSQYVPDDITAVASAVTPFNPATFLFKCAAVSAVLLVAAYSFAILAIMLAAKYAVLVVLYILSPLAFCCWVFPSTRSIWTKWWQTFIQWSFIGVSTAFFIYLSMKVLSSAVKPNQLTDINTLFVSFIFIYVGYKITASSAPMVSGAVMGMAKGVGAMAMGAVGGAAMGLGKMGARGASALDNKLTGGAIGNGARKLSSGVDRAMVGFGLRSAGVHAGQGEAQIKEASGRIGNLDEAAKTSMYKSNRTSERDRTAIVMDKIKNGNIDDLGNTNEQHLAIARAEAHMGSLGMSTGSMRKDAEGVNYKLAALNIKKRQKVYDAHPSVTDEAVVTRMINHEQLATNIPKMSATALGGIDHADVSGDDNFEFVQENFTPRALKQIKLTGGTDLVAGLSGQAGNFAAAKNQAAAHGDNSEATRMRKMEEATSRMTTP